MNTSLWIQISAQIFSFLVGVVSYRKRSVSKSGLIALLLISGLFIWLNQIALLFVLFAMFASSSLLTRYKSSSKKEFEEVVAKTGPRDYVQALANLGTATFILLLFQWQNHEALIAAFAGSVAAGNADSWASEIGGLSRRTPVLITTFKPVPKGISGGVTITGITGGIAGSFFISAVTLGAICIFSGCPTHPALLFTSSLIAGIIGCLLDSYFGALFQALYKNEDKDMLSENPQGNTKLVKGIRWIGNDGVNLLCTFAGGLIAGLIYYVMV